MSTEADSPAKLWYESGEDADRYRELLREHGHIVKCECSCHADGSGHCEKCKPQLPCGWSP